MRWIWLTLLPLLLAAQIPAEKPSLQTIDPVAAEKIAAQAKADHERNVVKYRGNPDFLVLPGLLADRESRTVRLWGRATAVQLNDPVEFFLIPTDSGKDYEALAVTFAKPSDVHRALEFIGMKPGRPVNYQANQYWPRGPRVLITFEWQAKKRARAEQLLIDTRLRKPLPLTGFSFTGSYRFTPEAGAAEIYAADAIDPRSIASDYNDRGTVLDLPRQSGQGDSYGFLKINPEFHLPAGEPLSIILEPEYRDGKVRITDLKLAIKPGTGQKLQELTWALVGADGKPAAEGQTLVHAMASFEKLNSSGHDPFVTVQMDDSLPLATVRQVYSLLQSLDNEQGIRIEAPPAGHLYYRAFFPREEWRDRKQRLGRPWELHLTENKGALIGKLELPADEIDQKSGRADLLFENLSADQCAQKLVENSDRWSQTVYVFVPDTIEYGKLMAYLRPAMKTHSMIHVFSMK